MAVSMNVDWQGCDYVYFNISSDKGDPGVFTVKSFLHTHSKSRQMQIMFVIRFTKTHILYVVKCKQKCIKLHLDFIHMDVSSLMTVNGTHVSEIDRQHATECCSCHARL